MSDLGRFAFEPILNLVHGRPVGVEVARSQARDRSESVVRNAVWGSRQLAEFDSGIAIASVLHGSGYDATVPLHVDVLADTVVAARRRVSQLQQCLRGREGDRPVPPILLEIGPALLAAPPTALAEGVAELRAEGYGIGFDEAGRGFGLDMIAELGPDLVKIDAGLVARLPTDPRARTVVGALCDVCRATGVRVSAVGVSGLDELAAVRDHGIPWAQGPLLATAQRRPSTAGLLLPVGLLPRIVHGDRPDVPSPVPRTAAPARSTLADLAQSPVGLPDDATAEQVRLALADHPQSGCVVLLDGNGRPTGFLDRNRFMLAISGPFGRALYADRPARSLAEAARTASIDCDVRSALEKCLAGDRTRSYDDLVLVDGSGSCVGVARVTDLLQEAAGTTSAA